MTDVPHGMPRGACLALRSAAVALAAGLIAGLLGLGPAAEVLPPGAASALAVALAASALLAVTRHSRVGMSGIAVAAILLDLGGMGSHPETAMLVPFCHASRWLGPLAFVAATSARADGMRAARTMLAIAAAATFAGHGIKAFQAPPNFVAYLDCACRTIAGAPCSTDVSGALLVAIGCADLLVAALVLAGRRGATAALGWMVVWGAATAAVRIAHGGLDAWPLAAERVANAAVPLALLMLGRAHTPKGR